MAAHALSNQMTRIVRVDRLKLIVTLQENRSGHVRAFHEAMAGYKAMALLKIEEAFRGLDARLADRKAAIIQQVESFTAETAGDFSNYFVLLEQVVVDLKVPVSYADAYDAAIDMAKFDTRSELDLSGAEFQCFCRDVWDWTNEFKSVNSNYARLRK